MDAISRSWGKSSLDTALQALHEFDVLMPFVRFAEQEGRRHIYRVDDPGVTVRLCDGEELRPSKLNQFWATEILRGGDKTCDDCRYDLAVAIQNEVPMWFWDNTKNTEGSDQ